jgi:hypothetical protein
VDDEMDCNKNDALREAFASFQGHQPYPNQLVAEFLNSFQWTLENLHSYTRRTNKCNFHRIQEFKYIRVENLMALVDINPSICQHLGHHYNSAILCEFICTRHPRYLTHVPHAFQTDTICRTLIALDPKCIRLCNETFIKKYYAQYNE